MKTAVLFDLGNTLVRYFTRAEFPAVLAQALAATEDWLRQHDLLRVTPEVVAERVASVRQEAADFHVVPLAQRLATIYDTPATLSSEELDALQRRFMAPLFACARVYTDTLPTLARLRATGLRTAIVSNSPWGSPAHLWHAELERLDLAQRVDVAVFCADVGWRKPARQIFEHVLAHLNVPVEECLFVGDDPRWDMVGPRNIGMEAVLIDRESSYAGAEEQPIHALDELWSKL